MNAMQKHRQAKHWSKAELARRAGLNACTVGLIENRRLRPYDGQLSKLGRAGLRGQQLDELHRDLGGER